MHEKLPLYPSSDLDRPDALIAALGSFWARLYTAKDQLNSYVQSTSVLAAQTYQNLLETVQALSRYDVPIFHRQFWQPIVLRKSNLGTIVNNFFDESGRRFDVEPLNFDGLGGSTLFYFQAPPDLVSVKQLFNQIIAPTTVFSEGVDYIVDTKINALILTKNPFENPAFLRRQVVTGGVADEEIVLWGFNADFDYEYIFNQFAYALNLRLKSGQNFKDFLNALINSFLNGGAAARDIDTVLSVLCGIPVVAGARETVEVVDHDNHGLFVATDQRVYRFRATAEPVVVPGQVVFAGDQLVDGFKVDELFVSSPSTPGDDTLCCPAPNVELWASAATSLVTENDAALILNPNQPVCRQPGVLQSLALDSGFLAACFYGDLVFENRPLPVHVDAAHPSGYTFVSFPVRGLPADVDNFFNEIHARGVEAAQQENPPCPPGTKKYTLAHYLDKRTNRISEPTAAHLPAAINPLKFIVENVLRNNLFIVKINTNALGQNRLGLYNIRQVRRLIPPGTAMLLVFNLAPRTDIISAEDDIHEQLRTFVGAEPAADVIDENFVQDSGATARLLSGTCQ
jgi:hypothetical protein